MTFPERLFVEPCAGLYVHIPFCVCKCRYCDFNSYPGLDWLAARYAAALARELALWADVISTGGGKSRMATVYFGGGTPPLLGTGRLVSTLAKARDLYELGEDAEVSVETNPGVVDLEALRALRAAGFNRLSIGVQSFDDSLLGLLGRVHSAAEAGAAFALGRQAGFGNMSLDLMYGIPGQTTSCWRNDLDRALALGPEHLSLYALTLEPGTPLAESIKSGVIAGPDEDLSADMFSLAEDVLEGAGYVHYEISNWARPGRECLHNLGYWRNWPYLGAGAGACSRLGAYRFSNVTDPERYVEVLESGSPPGAMGRAVDGEISNGHAAAQLLDAGLPVSSLEYLPEETAMAETMMLGLRLTEGVSAGDFRKRFGKDVMATYRDQIEDLVRIGLLERQGGALRLTRRGRLLGNQVFCRFVA